jgi:hypothetical protein
VKRQRLDVGDKWFEEKTGTQTPYTPHPMHECQKKGVARRAICKWMKTLERGKRVVQERRRNVCRSKNRNVEERRRADEEGKRKTGGDRIRYTQERIAWKYTACQMICWVSFEWNGKVLKSWGLRGRRAEFMVRGREGEKYWEKRMK